MSGVSKGGGEGSDLVPSLLLKLRNEGLGGWITICMEPFVYKPVSKD